MANEHRHKPRRPGRSKPTLPDLTSPIVQRARVNVMPSRNFTYARPGLLRCRYNPKLLFKLPPAPTLPPTNDLNRAVRHRLNNDLTVRSKVTNLGINHTVNARRDSPDAYARCRHIRLPQLVGARLGELRRRQSFTALAWVSIFTFRTGRRSGADARDAGARSASRHFDLLADSCVQTLRVVAIARPSWPGEAQSSWQALTGPSVAALALREWPGQARP
jgi:hypothetical protein